MNYQRIYDQLINSRKPRGFQRKIGYEVHHIVPKCLGGTNEVDNLVQLTIREHYVAHWLLCKQYPSEAKIQYAFLCMLRNPHGHRLMTSRMYETIKLNFSKFRQWHHKVFNPGKTEQSRIAARQRMNGDGNPMRGRPERNPTARPHRVVFDDGTERVYQYGKLGYEDIGMSRSSWITAVCKGIPVPTFKVKQIIKE